MTLEELYSALLIELPDLAASTYYDHIEIDEGDEIYPPFIFFHEVNGNPFFADNRTYYLSIENRIDVYTADRSIDTRRAVCSFLDGLGIGYTLSLDEFDADTGLYMDSFNLNLKESEATPAPTPDPADEPASEPTGEEDNEDDIEPEE